MALTFLIAILSLPLLVYLLQEYRDARGKRRNDAGRCYQCGAIMAPPVPVLHYHYRSPSTVHFYCAACASTEGWKSRIWISVGLLAAGATFAALALRESVWPSWSAAAFGIASMLIAVLVSLLLFAPRKSAPREEKK